MRNRFSPGCTVWIRSPETAAVGAGVGATVGTGIGVKTTVTAVVGVGVASSGLGVGVIVGTTSEVGVGEATGTTVRPVGVVTDAVGVTCTSETTAGLARLQPAIRATRSRAKVTIASAFFFMLLSSFLEKATAVKLHKSYHN